MSHQASGEIRGPRTDDRRPRDIIFGIYGYPAVLVAHDLKLFPLLGERPCTLPEVCGKLGLDPRPAQALLTVCTALELVYVEGDRYALTPLAEDYFLDRSPTYLGGLLDLMTANYAMFSFEKVKQAVLTNDPQVYRGQNWIKSHSEQADRSRAFTRAMHNLSMGPALVWPDVVDLDEHRLMLDIGGGSGAHSIGVTQRWHRLHATVFDLAPVCDVAAEFVARHGLQHRIGTQVGDMWSETAFPPADLHFYSQICHDWPPEKCRFLTRKSFQSLASGGRIILHEILYNDEKTGPFAAAAVSINMLLWTEGGRQYSGRELCAMLSDAGFTDLKVQPTFGYWSIVSGRKP